MSIESMSDYLLLFCMLFLSVTMLLCLVRSIIGPRITDRIVAINMLCTQLIIFICVLELYLGGRGLVDISILYAMLSFLSVVVLVKLYIGAYIRRHPGGNGGQKS